MPLLSSPVKQEFPGTTGLELWPGICESLEGTTQPLAESLHLTLLPSGVETCFWGIVLLVSLLTFASSPRGAVFALGQALGQSGVQAALSLGGLCA